MTEHFDEFLSGRLDPADETALEVHLLTCDACFAAYLVRTLPDL